MHHNRKDEEDEIMDIKELLRNYETIPREKIDVGNKELRAIKNVRQMLSYMEKKVMNQLTEKDKKRVSEKEKIWLESIEVLREYIEKN